MGVGVRIGGEQREKGWPIHIHKGQRVIIWGTGYSPDGAEKVVVTYSYLRDHGQIAPSRTKSVWDGDFYEEFQPIGLGPEAIVRLKWEAVDED